VQKKTRRLERARRTRAKIAELGVHRLCVHRTPRHIYAQITNADGSETVACASSLEQELRVQLKSTGNVAAAIMVGKSVAEKAKAMGIDRVAFDRSGFKYHGRIKALADAARENGLQF
jgi:large subunit ribosomal protein L18